MKDLQRLRLHERGFICNRIVFYAVTPSVYATPIETVAKTLPKVERLQNDRFHLSCKRRNHIDLSTVTIMARHLHSSIQIGAFCTKFSARMCHNITSHMLSFPEAIQNITIFQLDLFPINTLSRFTAFVFISYFSKELSRTK